MSNFSLDELAAELEAFAPPERPVGYSAREERIITGFEEITDFVSEHGVEPIDQQGKDIFERMLAVRLQALRANDEARELLASFDSEGLLSTPAPEPIDEFSIDDLAAALGGDNDEGDITRLTHVSSGGSKNTPDEIAVRQPAEDFHLYEAAFHRVAEELRSGVQVAREFVGQRDIVQGGWYIVGGMLAYVAEVGETFRAAYGNDDARLRVIYSNGTESNLLARSLQKAMRQPPLGRVVGSPNANPLFGLDATSDDTETGTIYVLRSESQNPIVQQHREVLHKIGVTTGSVERRVGNAKNDPTFLMADVEIIATYNVLNTHPGKLEKLIHKVFRPARLDVQIKDRFGRPFVPQEWFLVPLSVINEAVNRIVDGSIVNYVYDPSKAQLVEA